MSLTAVNAAWRADQSVDANRSEKYLGSRSRPFCNGIPELSLFCVAPVDNASDCTPERSLRAVNWCPISKGLSARARFRSFQVGFDAIEKVTGAPRCVDRR